MFGSRIREVEAERIHRRVNALFHDGALEGDGRIEVRERRHRRGIGIVIRRDIDRLHGGDRSGAGRGDPFLQLTHFGCQGRLVSHRGRHAAEQRGDFGAGHGEAEDVIDEEQHIPALVTEIFRHGKRRQRHAQAHARRLVHLAVNHDGILHNARLEHFTIELGAFTGALAHTGEHRVAFMFGRHRADKLHDDDGLASACPAEDAGLAALGEGSDQVDDFDAGFEDFHTGGLL